MMLVFLFVVLLILTFAVLLYFLKPTSMEKAVAEQLASIEGPDRPLADPTTILKDEAVDSSPLVDDLVRLIPWSSAASRLIKQSGTGWRIGSVIMFSFGAALVVGWLAWAITSQTAVTLGLGLAAGLVPYVCLYIFRETRFRKFDALLPEAVDLMSRGLRAGHSIASVMEMVGNEIADPVGAEFRSLHKEQSLGLPVREAMLNLVERIPIDDLRFLATAILLQKESGGNLVQILDKTSAVLRERARLRGQLRIYTAQGRITGWILCAAPFLMFGLISITNHKYEATLFTDPFGLKLVYVGLGLMVLGVLVIRKIIDVKV
jgi:tight adherence protein B